jgi:lysophospholipase L1-like esterase
MLAALAVLSTCSGGTCTAPREDRAVDAAATPRFLALGDSFTIGTGSPPDAAFPARLVAKWNDAKCSVDLRNVAVNGYTTDDLIAKELAEVERYHPTFVTLAIGANDIVRGRPPEAYRANVKRIFRSLGGARAGGMRIVVLPQPDWSRSPAAAAFGDPSATAEKIKQFNDILASETSAFGATWVDLSPLMEKQAADRMIAGDGLHPSAAAYGAWADALAQQLKPPCGP